MNVYAQWGDALVNSRKFKKAQQKYTQALVKYPNNTDIITKLQKLDKWLGIDFVFIKGGSFSMGSPSAIGEKDEHPSHGVNLSSFFISQYEITFEQYDKFCKATGRKKTYANGWGRGNRPVINISHANARAFCIWLSGNTGIKVRLPKEAEWEYAARGRGKKINGKKFQWAGPEKDSELGEYAWFASNSGAKTHPVGSKKPNSLGIYDMSGNVYEWCSDRYDDDYYKKSPPTNPQGPAKGNKFIIRGGSALSAAYDIRCSSRSANKSNKWNFPTGFRIASVP